MAKTIQNPDVAQQLQKLFGLVGRVRPALDDVVVPVVQVGDLSAGGNPPFVRRAAASHGIAAVPAEYPSWKFEIPAGIGALITKVYAEGPGTAPRELWVNFNDADPGVIYANTATSQFADQRVGSSTPAGRLHYDTQAPGWATYRFKIPGNGVTTPIIVTNPGWVVAGIDNAPGYLNFQGETVNETWPNFSLEWVEFNLR